MPRLKKARPKFRKKRMRSGGQVKEYACVSLNGKEHLLGPYDPKESSPAKQRYRELIAAWEQRGRIPKPDPGDVKMVTHLCVEYFKSVLESGADVEELRPAIKALRQESGDLAAVQFTAARFQRFRDVITARRWSRKRIRQACNTVMAVFQFAAEQRCFEGADFIYETLSVEMARWDVLVRDICRTYEKHARLYYVKNGVATSELATASLVIKELRAQFGDEPACDFGPIKFKKFRNHFVGRALRRTTVNHYMVHVLGAFQLALENQAFSEAAEVHLALRSVKRLRAGRTLAKESIRIGPVKLDMVDAVIPHLSPIVADMVSFQLLTGARPGEVCKIKPEELNRDNEVWTYCPGTHKTQHHGKERIIHIGPEAQKLLTPYLLRNQADFCFDPSEAVEQQRRQRLLARLTPVKYGNRPGTNRKKTPKRRAGKHYSTDSYRRAIHRACDKAKVERWSPNRLRKAAATKIRAEFGLEAAQVVLGHANKSTTEMYYAAQAHDKGVEVAKKIG